MWDAEKGKYCTCHGGKDSLYIYDERCAIHGTPRTCAACNSMPTPHREWDHCLSCLVNDKAWDGQGSLRAEILSESLKAKLMVPQNKNAYCPTCGAAWNLHQPSVCANGHTYTGR